MSNHRAIIKTKPARNHAYEKALAAAEAISKPAPANHTPARWSCRHHIDGSDVAAYVMASGNLEIIARTQQGDGIDARANAELIVQAVNNQDKYWLLVSELAGALEHCLKCEGLDWAAEQEADIALQRARRVMGWFGT